MLILSSKDRLSYLNIIGVYNTLGQVQSVHIVPMDGNVSIDFSSLPSGIYLIKFNEGVKVYGCKVMKI